MLIFKSAVFNFNLENVLNFDSMPEWECANHIQSPWRWPGDPCILFRSVWPAGPASSSSMQMLWREEENCNQTGVRSGDVGEAQQGGEPGKPALGSPKAFWACSGAATDRLFKHCPHAWVVRWVHVATACSPSLMGGRVYHPTCAWWFLLIKGVEIQF